jgi:bifunctional enzyme CysN/CysC
MTVWHRWSENARKVISDMRDAGRFDLDAYLKAQNALPQLRFLTCGSVDDGKSTLIGRLLYDSKLIFDDHLAALEQDSRRHGTQGSAVDLALLVDGLAAEREQGITIDVAYRYFTTARRRFIVADTPGHEQYTRNMATGASTSDLAVILVDAGKGVRTQTRRHSYIVALFGIKQLVLAVNKMDLAAYSEQRFAEIEAEYRRYMHELAPDTTVTAIPMSALSGENVSAAAASMPWYRGPTLLEFLERVEIAYGPQDGPFRMPVQWVNRPNADFRGYSGTVTSGCVGVGQEVLVMPAEKPVRIARILRNGGVADEAVAGQAVTLVFDDEIDVSRGDVLCSTAHPVGVSDQLAAHLLWMSDKPLLPGRQYYLKLATRSVLCVVSALKAKINVNTQQSQPARQLELNEVGIGNISIGGRVAFAPFREDKTLGSFILIDRQSNETAGAGLIDFSLRRAGNVVRQLLTVDKAQRSRIKHQRPGVVWLTGLSGSGKSTIANLLEVRLHEQQRHTYVLDGDNVRHGLSRDLGFTAADRVENIRRVGEAARLMVDAGLITIVSFISPFRSERQMVREMLEPGEFIEIFVDTPLAVCERRDPKGLYRKARAGEIKNFTGIDSEYQPPEAPELVLRTERDSPEECVRQILDLLDSRAFLQED